MSEDEVRALIAKCERLLTYDSETGLFTRKTSGGGRRAGDRSGSIGSHGYIELSIEKERYLAHKIAWLMHYREWVASDIDHRNRIRTDNRIENLRRSTRSQNLANSTKRDGLSSEYRGVCWHAKAGKWCAYIGSNAPGATFKRRHLGLFETAEQARDAYIAAAKELYGDFATSQ
jgi:hypothetical protein